MTLSPDSLAKLATCHPDLQRVFRRVAEGLPFVVTCGFRGQEDQDRAFLTGHSTKRWPESRHNGHPSEAVDVAPLPIDWKDRERFALLAGYILATGHAMGVALTWGGDWNHNWVIRDERLQDLGHFELQRGGA